MSPTGRPEDTIEWNELLPVLLGYPSASFHAVLETRGDREPDVRYEVWRQGRKLRVEKDGLPDYVCDGETLWSFEEVAGVEGSDARPVASDARKALYCGPAQGLCAPRRSSDWQGSDFTTPEGPVTVEEFQGRDCWTVALKAPPRKVGPLRIWVDRDSGYPLGEVNESPEAKGYEQWFESPEIGIALDDSLFTWEGPSITKAELEDRRHQSLQALEESQMQWFRENVLATRLTVSSTVDLSPEQMRIEEGSVYGGTPGVFRFERTAVDQQQEAPRREADVVWRSGDHSWRVTFLSPEVIVDDKLTSEVRRRFSWRDREGR
ncbi:MAG: hypothetical protein ACI38U_01590 [Corynebacterium sp.]|uniref:hypothetical protein n=1 Tax=Corynebacterium sp. TaxID=1720 RepID=UPI003F058571